MVYKSITITTSITILLLHKGTMHHKIVTIVMILW
jgi:hypothetical protein